MKVDYDSEAHSILFEFGAGVAGKYVREEALILLVP